ncbi:hypothetical protein A4U64_26755 (plasmid) [Rhodococcus sp. WB1]|uniref:Pvc16 family protein n=1 Tax=Rhodococcus sp. WB1 TaxID=1033922 RepID=UPI00081A86D9|nr:Pvc16 family protein [Rhodococcus sp. WB1]ANZ28494.1 hypothetical protein A4U64_26755 [Rhodococcus sp. WB1]
MFGDLDLTLAKLLTDATVVPTMAGVAISFAPPDKTSTFDDPTFDLFLYGVRENRVLRNPVPILERVGPSFVRRTPPLRMDCDYLATAWSKEAGAAGVAEERKILADGLLKLSRFPTIPETYLQNAMVGQPFAVPMWVAQSDDSKSLGEFWSALGVSPRASFHLVVTIAMDVGVTTSEGPPVTTREVRLEDDLDPATRGESVFSIGGVVRDGAGGIAGATVTVDGRRPARTDAAGRFRIRGLDAGTHTLRATAPGHVDRAEEITVPAAAVNDYDITFPP